MFHKSISPKENVIARLKLTYFTVQHISHYAMENILSEWNELN